jgi:hypothetical protein
LALFDLRVFNILFFVVISNFYQIYERLLFESQASIKKLKRKSPLCEVSRLAEKLKVIVCNKYYSYFKSNSLSLGKFTCRGRGWG